MKENKKKILIILVGILIAIGIVLGTSYAWWTTRTTQESINTITSSCLKIELTDINNSHIQLEKAYPITDEEASELKPYVFAIKNTCNTSVEYDVKLEIMEVENRLKDEYIAVTLDYGEKVLLNKLENIETTYDKGDYSPIEGKHLTTDILGARETERYSLKLWMDEHVTINDDAMNKNFISKIVVNARLIEEEKETKDNIMIAYKENEYFWQHRENIDKIIITKNINPIEDASYIYDVSQSQNESIMAYLVANESDSSTYIMYIKSERGINANEDSSFLFYGFSKLESIEGLEYLNTSDVKKWQGMFRGAIKIESLDVSHFDTSNAIEFIDLFYDCQKLTLLDLSNFNTSKVTNMISMFYNCKNLVNLNLNHFDTSNVKNMSWMFSKTNVINLDLSSFETSNVKLWTETFNLMPNNTIIKVRNKEEQEKILNLKGENRPLSWTEENVIIAP